MKHCLWCGQSYDASQDAYELREAIRTHRDERGDDRCWEDDERLYKALPEGYAPPERDTSVELENCKRYISCRRNPNTEYISPQREIEKLQEEIKYLKERIDGLLDNI